MIQPRRRELDLCIVLWLSQSEKESEEFCSFVQYLDAIRGTCAVAKACSERNLVTDKSWLMRQRLVALWHTPSLHDHWCYSGLYVTLQSQLFIEEEHDRLREVYTAFESERVRV